jgi:hypothetical protein
LHRSIGKGFAPMLTEHTEGQIINNFIFLYSTCNLVAHEYKILDIFLEEAEKLFDNVLLDGKKEKTE